MRKINTVHFQGQRSIKTDGLALVLFCEVEAETQRGNNILAPLLWAINNLFLTHYLPGCRKIGSSTVSGSPQRLARTVCVGDAAALGPCQDVFLTRRLEHWQSCTQSLGKNIQRQLEDMTVMKMRTFLGEFLGDWAQFSFHRSCWHNRSNIQIYIFVLNYLKHCGKSRPSSFKSFTGTFPSMAIFLVQRFCTQVQNSAQFRLWGKLNNLRIELL